MRIEQLEYLLEISKHKSMNIASEHLHLSPQGLSLSMKSLENELNMCLLIRDNQGVNLTENGRKLVGITEQFLNELNKLQTENNLELSLRKLKGVINLYLPESMADSYFTNILTDIYRDCPELDIKIHLLNYEDIIEKVRTKQIPYAFYTRCYIGNNDILNDIPLESMTYEPIFQVQLFCCMNKNHPLANKKQLSLKELKNTRIYLAKSFEYILNKIISYADLQPQKISSHSPKMIAELLEKTMGIAFSSFSFITDKNPNYTNEKCIYIPFADNIICETGYVVSKDTELNAETQIILNYIKSKIHNI